MATPSLPVKDALNADNDMVSALENAMDRFDHEVYLYVPTVKANAISVIQTFDPTVLLACGQINLENYLC